MKVLVACEFSGIVREAFAKRGHDAWSCDLLPTEIPGNHIQGDVLEILNDGWDLMIAHPPCTHLAVSGAKHFAQKRLDGRQQEGIDLFMEFVNTNIPKVCIENPVGIMSTLWRKPSQIIHPWQFGDESEKTTCLWLSGLPLLVPTNIVDKGEFVTTPSGKVLPKWYSNSKSSVVRSRTFQGIANAMAEQWSRI
jgi:site-specific DNA-cytosine methylase